MGIGNFISRARHKEKFGRDFDIMKIPWLASDWPGMRRNVSVTPCCCLSLIKELLWLLLQVQGTWPRARHPAGPTSSRTAHVRHLHTALCHIAVTEAGNELHKGVRRPQQHGVLRGRFRNARYPRVLHDDHQPSSVLHLQSRVLNGFLGVCQMSMLQAQRHDGYDRNLGFLLWRLRCYHLPSCNGKRALFHKHTFVSDDEVRAGAAAKWRRVSATWSRFRFGRSQHVQVHFQPVCNPWQATRTFAIGQSTRIGHLWKPWERRDGWLREWDAVRLEGPSWWKHLEDLFVLWTADCDPCSFWILCPYFQTI